MINIPPWLAAVATGAFLAWLFDEEKEMLDCSKEITSFYNSEVVLPEKMKSEMRDRRDANRARLKSGLDEDDPTPIGMWSQGSYAMHTMIQTEDNDFDIDDGVYFKKEDLTDASGIEKGTYDAKKMVRDAVDHHGLKEEPEIKDNCVRVKYGKGYHVDIPVYRTVNHGEENEYYELASANGWRESDPRAVTQWFNDTVTEQSPDSTNGQQMRRIVRLLKDVVKTNASAHEETPSGFLISKLVAEEYHAYEGRDDEALYYTMKNIRDRLNDSLEVEHPIVDEMLTTGSYDPAATVFNAQLNTALDTLDIIFGTEDAGEALEAWGNVFQEQGFFSDQASARSHKHDSDDLHANDDTLSAPSIWVKSDEDVSPVDKRGGGRNA